MKWYVSSYMPWRLTEISCQRGKLYWSCIGRVSGVWAPIVHNHLVVPHAGLASALVKVHVRLVNKHVASTESRVELPLELVLHVYGVAQTRVVGVVS